MPRDTAVSEPFDTALLKRRRARGRRGPDFLLQLAGEELLLRLAQLRADERAPLPWEKGRVLVCGPAWLARGVAHSWPQAHILRGEWLACSEKEDRADNAAMPLVLDHQRLPFADGTLSAVLVLLDFALVNDLPGALMEYRRVLRPGGALLTALPGGETLTELRAAWLAAERDEASAAGAPLPEPGWRVAPFLDLRQLARLAGMAGLTHVVTDVERLDLGYADALSLMQELKDAGWSNPLRQRPRRPTTRGLLARAAARYELANSRPDGRVSATMELLYLSARRPPSSSGAPSVEANV